MLSISFELMVKKTASVVFHGGIAPSDGLDHRGQGVDALSSTHERTVPRERRKHHRTARALSLVFEVPRGSLAWRGECEVFARLTRATLEVELSVAGRWPPELGTAIDSWRRTSPAPALDDPGAGFVGVSDGDSW